MSVFIFLLGLLIGSFLNVCIYRIPKDESIAYPPSHCTSCDNHIKFYDLIPVISYIILRGRCRHCGNKISLRYPTVELITGLLFLSVYLKFGISLHFIKYAILVCYLIVIGMIDYDTTDIYFKTTASGAAIGLLFMFLSFYFGYGILDFIYGGLLGGGIITFIVLLTGGMGWGDVELFLLCGLFVGLKLTIVALMLSFIIGGLVGMLLIVLKKKTRKDYIPFGPFISIATLAAILFGEQIIRCYFNFI